MSGPHDSSQAGAERTGQSTRPARVCKLMITDHLKQILAVCSLPRRKGCPLGPSSAYLPRSRGSAGTWSSRLTPQPCGGPEGTGRPTGGPTVRCRWCTAEGWRRKGPLPPAPTDSFCQRGIPPLRRERPSSWRCRPG